MTRRERNWLILLALVAVVSLPFLPFWGGEEVPEDDYDEDYLLEEGSSATGSSGFTRLPKLDLELLNRREESFSTARRNLFDFPSEIESAGDDEYIVDDVEEETVNDQQEEIPAVVRPKLTGYELIGIVEVGGLRLAVFSHRGREEYGAVGRVINNAFEIKEIGEDYVKIYVKNGGFEQRLKMKPAVGDSGQGE